MSGIDLSIIILSYNTKEFLRKCLESVISGQGSVASERLPVTSHQSPITSHRSPVTEVIVVDNGSTDGSVEMVREIVARGQLLVISDQGLGISGRGLGVGEKNVHRSPVTDHRSPVTPLRLIESPKNLGYSGGNNLGLKAAKGEFILFLNSDTELYSGALAKAVEFMKSDPKIGAMTPKTRLFSGGMDPDCHRGFPTPWASLTYFLGLENIFPKSEIFGQYHKFYQDLSSPHEIDAGFGTFMVVRREVADQIGDWDESYFFYGEDLDYFYRIKQAGWKIMFYPEPLLSHHKGGSSGLRKESRKISPATRQTRIRTAEASIKAMQIFYKKFYAGKYPSWLTAIVLSGIRIKGFFRLLFHFLKP